MDTWVKWATRQRDCILCTRKIMPGDKVLIGQFKRTGSYGTRTRQTASHLECWISKAHTYLDDNPYKPYVKAGPGRPTIFTPDEVRERKNTQVNMARWKKKQEEYLGLGMWAMADKYGDRISKARAMLTRSHEAIDGPNETTVEDLIAEYGG